MGAGGSSEDASKEPEAATAASGDDSKDGHSRTRNFPKLSSRERQAYLSWGVIVGAILVVELLGAISAGIRNWIPWPTISSTVGHLEIAWSGVAVIVVALITAVAYLALRHGSARSRAARKTPPARELVSRVCSTNPPENETWSLWSLVCDLLALALVGLGAALVATLTPASKHQLGYTIYGLLLVLGVIVPSIWAVAKPKQEPTLVSTIRSLHRRVPWISVVLISSLTVLVIHLAFYPWPDIQHESSKIGGLNGSQARQKGEHEISSRFGTRLEYRKEARGRLANNEVWLVYFDPPNQFDSGCVVAIENKSTVAVSAQCSRVG